MGKGKKGLLERLSWKAIIAAIISGLSVYFGFPEYMFNIRPHLVANLGSDSVSFIEGAISGAITVLLVLKFLSEKTSQQPNERSKAKPFQGVT